MKMIKQSRDMKIVSPFNIHEAINQFKRHEDDQAVRERSTSSREIKTINQATSMKLSTSSGEVKIISQFKRE
jgi:hypothetical protein